jgi:SAM-dependent methyltransferase
MQVGDPRVNRALSLILLLVFLPSLAAPGGLGQAKAPLVRINAPFIPTPPEVVAAMLKLAHLTKEDTLYDLGCGDGRIVITAAREYGTHAIGIDIDPERIRESRENASRAEVTGLVDFLHRDFFDADLSQATVVTVYLLPEVNRELLPKLLRQLKPGTRIVSHAFDFGTWKPEQAIEVSGCKIYLWTVPPHQTVQQTWDAHRDSGPAQ